MHRELSPDSWRIAKHFMDKPNKTGRVVIILKLSQFCGIDRHWKTITFSLESRISKCYPGPRMRTRFWLIDHLVKTTACGTQCHKYLLDVKNRYKLFVWSARIFAPFKANFCSYYGVNVRIILVISSCWNLVCFQTALELHFCSPKPPSYTNKLPLNLGVYRGS